MHIEKTMVQLEIQSVRHKIYISLFHISITHRCKFTFKSIMMMDLHFVSQPFPFSLSLFLILSLLLLYILFIYCQRSTLICMLACTERIWLGFVHSNALEKHTACIRMRQCEIVFNRHEKPQLRIGIMSYYKGHAHSNKQPTNWYPIFNSSMRNDIQCVCVCLLVCKTNKASSFTNQCYFTWMFAISPHMSPSMTMSQSIIIIQY